MSLDRTIARIVTTAPPAPGFAGPGHTAVEVVAPEDFARNDPFILLMDDRVEDRHGAPIGGAHPHAGLETVTFMLEGSSRDGEAPVLGPGDVEWMTAGRCIVHGEDVISKGNLRLLQLWLTLPKAKRWTEPRSQEIFGAEVPARREPGAELRLYSGSSGALRSPTRNHVPVTLADIRLAPGAGIEQELPASYNGFLYVLEGSAAVGEARLAAGQVGWLDRPSGQGGSVLRIRGGGEGARLLLYAGEPQGDPIVMHGPFVADRKEEIAPLFRAYRQGSFPRMSELDRAKKARREPATAE